MADLIDWFSANWVWVYMICGFVIGCLVWLGTLAAVWSMAASKYELGGLVLGWIPGGIAGALAGGLIGLTWPLSVPFVGSWLLSLSDRDEFGN